MLKARVSFGFISLHFLAFHERRSYCQNQNFSLNCIKYLTHYCPAMPFGNRKKYFRVSFQFSIVTIHKKYHPSGNLKFNYLGIFQSLKLRIFVGKIISISLKLNFTPNTLGCYGLNRESLWLAEKVGSILA